MLYLVPVRALAIFRDLGARHRHLGSFKQSMLCFVQDIAWYCYISAFWDMYLSTVTNFQGGTQLTQPHIFPDPLIIWGSWRCLYLCLLCWLQILRNPFQRENGWLHIWRTRSQSLTQSLARSRDSPALLAAGTLDLKRFDRFAWLSSRKQAYLSFPSKEKLDMDMAFCICIEMI